MKQYVEEAIEEIEKAKNGLASKISEGIYSSYGETLAIEMIETLGKILEFLKSKNSNDSRVDEIIIRLPLLYIQIKQIN